MNRDEARAAEERAWTRRQNELKHERGVRGAEAVLGAG